MVSKDSELMQIEPDEQFLKNYQALYYAMNAKPDCKSKLFPKDVVVSLQDLINLNEKITDKFKAHYDDAGFRINVNVCYKNRETLEFDSWTTFEKYSWNTEKIIDSMLIVWEYNAKLPNFKLPQKHTLTVRIADELRPEEMLNLVISGKLEEVDKIQQEICPIVARVDYINSTLGDELLGIVDSWQKGLMSPNICDDGVFKTLRKASRTIAYGINYISTAIAIWCTVKFLGMQLASFGVELVGEIQIEEVTQLVYTCAIGAFICVGVYKIFQIIANIVFSALRSSEDNHTFTITNGDKVEYQKIEKGIKSKKRKVIVNLVLTFIFNVICSVVANMIPV